MPRRKQALLVLFLAFIAATNPAAANCRLFFGAPQEPPGSTTSAPTAGGDQAKSSAGNATTLTADDAAAREDEPCSDLEVRVQTVSDGLAAALAEVDVAQCILARRCAPPLSLQLAGSDRPDERLVAAANSALALLNRASRCIEHDAAEEATQRTLLNRIESLRAFGELFAALGQGAGDEAARKKLLAACSRLAPSLDEPDAELVESAKLWLGFAYRRAGRPDRTLQVVRPIITAPTSRRIGLLARLERCRALGETGRHAAGIALCERLAVRVDAWLAREDEATRTKASDSIRHVRMELLRGWADELRKAGEDDRAAAADAEAAKLRGSEADPPPLDSWLPLEVAVAGLPERPVPAASRPADGGELP